MHGHTNIKSLKRVSRRYEATDGRTDGRTLIPLLGASAKLRKATVSIVMFFRLSAWNNSAQTGRIFMKFDI